jgi:SAM-dependent methyltransferase
MPTASHHPPITLHEIATAANFDEAGYLQANPDVAAAVTSQKVATGKQHFDAFGLKEGRRQLCLGELSGFKQRKLSRIRPILRTDLPVVETSACLDFLTPELREQFSIIDTSAVSSNEYDEDAMALIRRFPDGLILDCGAGSRSRYFSNVVNFEIALYPSTDVRGVGEVLPFKDHSFDAVLSLAVLEHVKDPWRCANEIKRVLKPGGELMCCVPFLQPVHGYPHHYYNMSEQGLRNLFEDQIEVTRHEVSAGVLPIWSLTWILGSWAEGLQGEARREFENLRVGDLLAQPREHLARPYVTGLSRAKNMELASATVLFGRKRG